MSSTVASRKRKAAALGTDDAPDGKRKSAPDDCPAYLPAPCLAAVLNFMWYTDVRQCMLAGKMMAVEAARHVETLNITKASELVVPASRRFENASEVNVLCLVSEMRDKVDDEYEFGPDLISMDTVVRVVPFLSSFPNLKRVYLGGLSVWGRYAYNTEGDREVSPYDHHIFKTLVENLIGGFQSRSLPQHLEMGGVLRDHQLDCVEIGGEVPDQPCQFCRRVLSSFPPHLLAKPISLDFGLCVPPIVSIRALLLRDGAEGLLRSRDGAEMLLSCLSAVVPQFVWTSSGSEVCEAFLKKMREQGSGTFGLDPKKLSIKWGRSPKRLYDFLDLVKSSPLLQDVIKGIHPSSGFSETITVLGTKKHGAKPIFARRIFDALLEAGLNLNARDYIIVDPEKEPALARYLDSESSDSDY